MTFLIRQTLRLGIVLFLTCLLTPAPTLADDRGTSSIAEFVAAKEQWNKRVGRPMRLEGRYTILSSSELLFKNCDMRFTLAKTFRRPPASVKNVEVGGQIVRNDGDLEFRVTDLQPRESDAEQLALRRSLVNNSRPDEVFELADWARQRGKFYEDDELLAAADRLYREGLTIAHEHLKSGDIDGLRELAKQVRDFQLEQGISLAFLHEANRLEWEAVRKSANEETKQKEYHNVWNHIQRDLPGAATPLTPDQLRIRSDYEKAPLAVYRLAESSTRRLLERAFAIEVGLAEILSQADDGGRNGYEIAARLERQLPEMSSLADEHRQQELKYLTARLSRLTRGQMLELSERYKSRGDEPQATQTIRNWLKAQEPQAQKAGPTDLMELGDEYVNLLNDERSAARMYKLAYNTNPQLATAAQWLSARGYELKGNDWSKPGETDEPMEDASVAAAIQEGRIDVGMSGAQVLQALGSKPSTAVRIASAGQISELWVFKDYGITVRLQRRSSTKSAKVIEIGTIE